MSNPQIAAQAVKRGSPKSSPPRNASAQAGRARSLSPATITLSSESSPPRSTPRAWQRDAHATRCARDERGPVRDYPPSERPSPRTRRGSPTVERQSPRSAGEAAEASRVEFDLEQDPDFASTMEIYEHEHALQTSLSPENVEKVKATLALYNRHLEALRREEDEYQANRERAPSHRREENGRLVEPFHARGVPIAASQAESIQRDERMSAIVDLVLKRSHLQMALVSAGNEHRFNGEMQAFWQTIQKQKSNSSGRRTGAMGGIAQKGKSAARWFRGR